MIHVEPRDIDDHWPMVRAGLEVIGGDYSPEHVYTALANGESFLALVDGGFIVWSRYPGDDRRGMLFIWLCQGKTPDRTPIYAEIEALAKQMKCRRIRIIGRKGWMRDPYWTFAGYVYEREVK